MDKDDEKHCDESVETFAYHVSLRVRNQRYSKSRDLCQMFNEEELKLPCDQRDPAKVEWLCDVSVFGRNHSYNFQ